MHPILAQSLSLPADTPWTAVVVVIILLAFTPIIKGWIEARSKQTEAKIEEAKAEAAETREVHATLGKQTDAMVEMVRNQSSQTQELAGMKGELRAHTTALTGNTEKLVELIEEVGDLRTSFDSTFKELVVKLQSPKGDKDQVKAAVTDLKAAVTDARDKIQSDVEPSGD